MASRSPDDRTKRVPTAMKVNAVQRERGSHLTRRAPRAYMKHCIAPSAAKGVGRASLASSHSPQTTDF